MKKAIASILTSTLLLTALNGCVQPSRHTYGENAHESMTQKDELGKAIKYATDNTLDLLSKTDTSNSSLTVSLKNYESVLNLYKELLADNHIDLETFTERSKQEFFSDLYDISYEIDSKKAGYALKDLNCDGIDERILLDDNGSIYAIYTLKDGKPFAVDYFSVNNFRGSIDVNGIIYKDSFSKGESFGFKVIRILENGELDCLEFGISDPAPGIVNARTFLYRNGHEEFVDETTVNTLYAKYSQYISYSTPTDIISKLNLNFMYIE